MDLRMNVKGIIVTIEYAYSEPAEGSYTTPGMDEYVELYGAYVGNASDMHEVPLDLLRSDLEDIVLKAHKELAEAGSDLAIYKD
jgi:hypothetical protein